MNWANNLESIQLCCKSRELCREHNDANIVTLSGRFVDVEENKRILDVFLSTDFGGGRHAGRVEKIMALETPSA